MCENCETNDGDPGATFQDGERLLLVDVGLLGLRWLGNVIGTTGNAVHGLGNLLGSHSTYVRNREAFAQTVGFEIEMLTAPMPKDET